MQRIYIDRKITILLVIFLVVITFIIVFQSSEEDIYSLGDPVIDVVFRPDSQFVLISTETHVYQWNIDENTTKVLSLNPPFSTVFTNKFATGGSYILAAGLDGTFTIWDLRNQVRTFQNLSAQPHTIQSIVWSHDTHRAATLFGHTVGLWDIQSKRMLQTIAGSQTIRDQFMINSLAWNPTADVVATLDDNALRLVDVQSGTILAQTNPTYGGTLAWSESGTFLAEGPQLWEVSNQVLTPGRVLKGPKDHANVTLFSPDNTLLAIGTGSYHEPGARVNDTSIYVWRVDNGKLLHHFEGHDDIVTSLAFSEDGHYLVSGSKDGTVRLWNLR